MSYNANVFAVSRVIDETLAAQGVPEYTGVSRHTSAQALPIPIMWGTRRISPNVLWQSNLQVAGTGVSVTFGTSDTTTPPNHDPSAWTAGGYFQGKIHITHTGGGTSDYFPGGDDPGNPISQWWMPILWGLCEGPIDSSAPLNADNGINRIWNGGGAPPVLWSSLGAISLPVGLYYWVFPGDTSQSAWGFWGATQQAGFGGQPIISIYPGANIAYRGTAYIATPLADFGHNNTPIQQSFEVCRTPDTSARLMDSYGISWDYNPAAIVLDLLTNAQYGVGGIVTGDLDATTLSNYRSYCGAQGLYLSPFLKAQSKTTDIINRFAQETNSWIYWAAGDFFFVPLGDEALSANGFTYTPDATPAYNLSNTDFIGPLQVDRADPVDCNNRIRLEYADRSNNYATTPIEWKDETLIGQFGILDGSSVSADDICDGAVAAKVIDLLGKRMAYIRNTYTFTLSYRYVRILPGTILTLTDLNLGISGVLVRVISVEENEKLNLKVVAEEYLGIGITRPQTVQPWGQSGGSGSGGGGTSPPGGSGVAVPTSGGVLTLTSAMNMVLYVAGDVMTLPNPMPAGVAFNFVHDLQRVSQPTPSDLESNPAKVVVPGGATFSIEEPEDRSLAPGASSFFKTTGGVYTLVYDGTAANIVRAFAA